MAEDLQKLELVIENFKEQEEILMPELNFFEIAGFPSRENVFSNVLKFYLNPKKPHGYGIRVLKIFLESFSDIPESELHDANIYREVVTNSKKRIDLVIETKNYVFGIENKVYHILNNDLKHYKEYLETKYDNKSVHILVLSLNGEASEVDCIVTFMSYKDLLKKMENLGSSDFSNKYEFFLKEFLQNLKNHFPSFMTKEQIDFLLINDEAINQIKKLSDIATNFIASKSSEIQKQIIIDESKWYFYRPVAFSFEIQTENIAPQYKLACTAQLSSIYIEVFCTDLKLYSKLQKRLSEDYTDSLKDQNNLIKIKNNWLYVREFKEVNKSGIEILIAQEIKKIIDLIDQFISEESNHVQLN